MNHLKKYSLFEGKKLIDERCQSINNIIDTCKDILIEIEDDGLRVEITKDELLSNKNHDLNISIDRPGPMMFNGSFYLSIENYKDLERTIEYMQEQKFTMNFIIILEKLGSFYEKISTLDELRNIPSFINIHFTFSYND